jgi:thermostable 8-oxoguanine DNA glycosylase
MCIFVAGKNSKIQNEKFNRMMGDLNYPEYPLDNLSLLSQSQIKEILIKHKIGQYNRISNCLYELSRSNLNLKTCSCEDLEKIPGIGYKTSRFFVVYSREDSNYAVLDTHILSWLRQYDDNITKSTPTDYKKYKQIEEFFLSKCRELNKKPSELDFEIWFERQKTWNT